jgi:hypothetical protein
MPYSVLERPFLWKHLIATNQVVTVPGTLHAITINRPDVGANALISVYDVAAAGDILPANMISNITMDDAFFVIPTTLIYDVGFVSGLYILFSAGITTADITVSYK